MDEQTARQKFDTLAEEVSACLKAKLSRNELLERIKDRLHFETLLPNKEGQ